MPLSSAKRAWIAIAVVILVFGIALVAIFLHSARHLSEPQAVVSPEVPVYVPSPQQKAETHSVMSEFPGGATGIAYLDVDALRKMPSSPVAAILGLTRGAPPSQDPDYQQFVRGTGFDYARDLSRAAVAFWPATGNKAVQDLNSSRFFIVADGKFNAKKIEAYALKWGKSLEKGGRTIYSVPGMPDVAFEFTSPTRITLASGHDPVDLLLRPRSTVDPALQARIDRVAGAPLFAVARTDALPNSFYDNFKNAPQVESLARSVKTLTLAAQPVSENLAVELVGETASMKDSLAITTLLEISRMAASMALSDPKTTAQMTKDQSAFLSALIAKLQIARKDRAVHIQFDVTPAMLGIGAPESSHAASTAAH
jgi:hypothetical protein